MGKERHILLEMVITVTVCFFCLLPVFHVMTTPHVPWRMIFEFDGIICGISSFILLFLGLIMEYENRRYRQIEMLKKLEN